MVIQKFVDNIYFNNYYQQISKISFLLTIKYYCINQFFKSFVIKKND